MSGGGPVYLQLAALGNAEDFNWASHSVADELERSGAGLDAVEQVIGFMEAHPGIYFGSPGALTHLIERFYRRGYEGLVVQSVQRRPTEHTLWLLHRILNDTAPGSEHEQLSAIHRDAERRLG